MSDIARHLRVLGIAVAIVAIDLILVRLAGPDTKPFHWTNFAGVYNNPAPTTTGITPISATAGTIGFSLTINGSNFVSNSIVYWNGTALATSYVDSTQLTATVAQANIAKADITSITVFNPAPGGGISNPQDFTIHNPIPITNSLSPTFVIAGTSGFTLTVNGNNFVNSSIVYWNSTALATTYVESTQLTAIITAADIAKAGFASVTVFNPPPGGGTSVAQLFTIQSRGYLPLIMR